jgi:hypothetical protein
MVTTIRQEGGRVLGASCAWQVAVEAQIRVMWREMQRQRRTARHKNGEVRIFHRRLAGQITMMLRVLLTIRREAKNG